jgi:hypothetical protein
LKEATVHVDGLTAAQATPAREKHLDFMARRRGPENALEPRMLWTIALVLLVLWAAGLVSSVSMGGLVHLLLVAAVVVVLVRLIRGRRIA